MLTIDEREEGGAVIVHPSGKLDTLTARTFETYIDGRIENHAGPLIVDMSDVDYISSFGLRSILIAAKKLTPYGRRLVLFSPNPSVHEVLRVSGFLKIVDVADSQEAALAQAFGANAGTG